jgi:phosphoglycerate dehydrogenase-like enzyme
MLQAMRASGVVPMARVPWMEPGIIMKVLDAGAYVIRTQPLSATTIADARQLKIVSRHGVGYDAVDVPALNNRRIPLCIVGDVNSLSVTEHVILLILACAKRLIRADRSVRACSWEWRNRLEATDIYGKRLLIVGYGRIGGHLARLATGFGMEIRAFDPLLAERGWPEGPVNPAPTLADGLAWADVVSVSVPKAARPILGVEEFLAHEARRHPRQWTKQHCRRRWPMGGLSLRVSTSSTTSRPHKIIRCSASIRWCSRSTLRSYTAGG